MVNDESSAGRNAAILGATAVAVGVLFLYPTSSNRGTSVQRPGQLAPAGIVAAPGTTPAGGGTTGTGGGTGTTGTGTGGGTGTTGTGGGAGTSSSASIVVNGSPGDTPFGPVQVQLTIKAGKIVSASAIVFPQGSGRDQEINAYAIPILQQETVAAQSAQIDSVSGATYTSGGYQQSLQSALDAAHLK
jgi:uncharacterized protein with FMN-binding domain